MQAIGRIERAPQKEELHTLVRELWDYLLPRKTSRRKQVFSKKQSRQIIDALLSTSVPINGLAHEMVKREICFKPIPRFPSAVILEWLEEFSKLGRQDELGTLIEMLDLRGMPPPPDRVIGWAMRGLASVSKKQAAKLLVRPDCIQHPGLDLERIAQEAELAAVTGDHAVARLFPLLILNLRTETMGLKRRGYLCLARIIVSAISERDDPFLPQFLLEMARDKFCPRTYGRLVAAYEKGVLQAEQQALQNLLKRRTALAAMKKAK